MLLNAIYTMSLKDCLEIDPTCLDGIAWDDSDRTQALKDMVVAKFYNWEISGETIPEFKLFIKYKFEQYKDYYEEMLDAYETQINFLDGDKRTTEYEDDSVLTPRAQYESVNYDLPRSDTSINRPTSKSTNGGVSGTDTTHAEGARTTKGGNVIELKKNYLNMIRNLYEEFASKFKPCFIELWS